MPTFTDNVATDMDAKSPVDDALVERIGNNQNYLKDQITDGTGADQTIVTNKLEAKSATGNGLDVTNDALIQGDLAVSGQLTTGSFFVSDFVQNFEDWA